MLYCTGSVLLSTVLSRSLLLNTRKPKTLWEMLHLLILRPEAAFIVLPIVLDSLAGTVYLLKVDNELHFIKSGAKVPGGSAPLMGRLPEANLHCVLWQSAGEPLPGSPLLPDKKDRRNRLSHESLLVLLRDVTAQLLLLQV